MKQPQNNPELANWCIVNALRLPSELRVSIVAKIMQHLTDDEIGEVIRLSGRSEQLFCPNCESTDIHENFHTDTYGCNGCGHYWTKSLPIHDVSVSLLERAASLVGNPCTNISSSTDMACDEWQKDYERWRNEH